MDIGYIVEDYCLHLGRNLVASELRVSVYLRLKIILSIS